MKFNTTITGHGPDAFAFLGDPSTNFIILFNEDAPPALAELCVLHTKTELMADIEVGDTFVIGKKAFTVSAVGSEANATLKGLGHATIDFKGGPEPERPGCIMLESAGEDLVVDDLKSGTKIEVY